MESGLKEWTAELATWFAVNNGYYLDKAIALLEQFQSGSVHPIVKRIKVADITGVTAQEITFALQNLNDVDGLPEVLRRVDMYGTELLADSGERVIGADFVIENTKQLPQTLSILHAIKAQRHKRLIFENEIFKYRGNPLDISPGTHIYDLLKAIYLYCQGQGRSVSYARLYEVLRAVGRYKKTTDKELKQLVQKYLITTGYELDDKVRAVDAHAEPLFKTNKNAGIVFIND